MHKLQAVYEGGVLRPTEALPLKEHQVVSVIILDEQPGSEAIEFESAQHFEALADRTIDRTTVRSALSNIPGSLDAEANLDKLRGLFFADLAGLPVINPLQKS